MTNLVLNMNKKKNRKKIPKIVGEIKPMISYCNKRERNHIAEDARFIIHGTIPWCKHCGKDLYSYEKK